VEMVPRKEYIGFKRGSNFVDIEFQKKQLKIFINMKYGSIPDPMNISRDVSKVGHYGNGEYEIKVNRETDLDYLMLMIKQSYNFKS
jgi:predicted transport protein